MTKPKLERIVDLEIPLIEENGSKKYQIELLAQTLEQYGFPMDPSKNRYIYRTCHGLKSVETLFDILESNALMGPQLVQKYLKQKGKNRAYTFPEQEYTIGNPPDNGDFAGLAHLTHALHVATMGMNLGTAFNEYHPVVLGFKLKTDWPILSINYIKLDDPKIGLKLLIAPLKDKEEIEAKIKEHYPNPKFSRIYVSFAPQQK